MFKAKELTELVKNKWSLIPGCSRYDTPKGTFRLEYNWYQRFGEDFITICMFRGNSHPQLWGRRPRDYKEWKYKPSELPLALRRWRQNTFRHYPTEALKVLELYAKEHGIN